MKKAIEHIQIECFLFLSYGLAFYSENINPAYFWRTIAWKAFYFFPKE